MSDFNFLCLKIALIAVLPLMSAGIGAIIVTWLRKGAKNKMITSSVSPVTEPTATDSAKENK